MIVISAGRRIDAADAAEARFPLKNVDAVARAIRSRLEDLGANTLVCSAACGADLIALKEAGELGVRRRVVLPFKPARFRRTSVTDRPGTPAWDWGAIFDRLIRAASERGDLVIARSPADETAAYAATNNGIISEAQKLAREVAARSDGEEGRARIVAVVIWEGVSRGVDDLTAEFAAAARKAGIPVEQINTLRVAGGREG